MVKHVLRTNDRAEAEAFISDTFLPMSIDLELSQWTQIELESIRLSDTVVGRISTSHRARMFSTDAAENFHINIPTRGRVVFKRKEVLQSTSRGSASVFAPGQSPDTFWLERTIQTCLMIPKTSMETAMSEFLGKPLPRRLLMSPVMHLDRPKATGFSSLLSLLLSELSGEQALTTHDVAQRNFERLLIDAILLGHTHNYTDAVYPDAATPGSRVSAEARDFMENDPAAPWTSLSLASSVHVSVRTLQYAFMRDFGESPMNYLRNLRMRFIRDELLKSGDIKVPIKTIAARWGFSHMGRFSATYRAMYSELPSETVARLRA